MVWTCSYFHFLSKLHELAWFFHSLPHLCCKDNTFAQVTETSFYLDHAVYLNWFSSVANVTLIMAFTFKVCKFFSLWDSWFRWRHLLQQTQDRFSQLGTFWSLFRQNQSLPFSSFPHLQFMDYCWMFLGAETYTFFMDLILYTLFDTIYKTLLSALFLYTLLCILIADLMSSQA